MGRRRREHRDSRAYEDWMDASHQDSLAAELLITYSRLYKSCAFHCQQCAEKALKAYLLFKTKQLVDGHNLTWLCKQAVKHDYKFSVWLDESAKLNHFYIETRYPSDFDMSLTAERIAFIMKMARDMNNFIYKEIIVD